ncbi:MAG TPA: hypothetical protein VFT64_01925 [Rickettsiales bacterium]|nr:hypothetical protein [Rickettsiales bacterium]
MSNRSLLRAALLALVIVMPQTTFGQALPWKSGGGAPQQQPQQPVIRTHHVSNPEPIAGPVPEASSPEEDDRKLNDLASKFYGIHEKDKNAIARLTVLSKEVRHFRVTLQHRDAQPDVLADTKHLEHRIARQLKEWQTRAQQPQTPPAK